MMDSRVRGNDDFNYCTLPPAVIPVRRVMRPAGTHARKGRRPATLGPPRETPMHVLLTGGTGFVGQALCPALLARGWRVSVLSRDRARVTQRLPAGVHGVESLDELAAGPALDGVVNLAGENLGGGRWTAARKQRFLDSRVQGTRALVAFLAAQNPRPRVLVSASAIGWYGPRGDTPLGEDAAPGSGFQSELCRAWETEARAAEALGMRVCRARIGVVLDAGGGALARMLPPFRLGLGGPVGDGRQWMSWIHRADLVALLIWLLEQDQARGAYNATAPAPLRNAAFAQALGRALRRPARLPMPGFALRLLLGEMADLLLTGQRVLPVRALAQGFVFTYPDADTALRQILKR
jgi:uncharacterized protein